VGVGEGRGWKGWSDASLVWVGNGKEQKEWGKWFQSRSGEREGMRVIIHQR